MLELLKSTLIYVVETLVHNAPSLLLGILVAGVIKVYVNPERFKQALMRRANISIPGSVAFGAFTPFCACGTMAVILSMLATTLPWGPIMAFLTSSPLMSPDQFILLSGIIGPEFAIALTVSSLIIGLGSGYATHFIERDTGFLADQARMGSEAASSESSCGCSCACEAPRTRLAGFAERLKLKELGRTLFDVGVKKILLYFSIFAAVGYFINRFVPTDIISSLFGTDSILSVPLAAIIGLPLYVSGSSSIPLIHSLMEGGASSGAMLAFMITGPGTSAGVIAGIATIMKKKAIALYVGYILAGGILLGYAYDFVLAMLQ